MPAVSELAVTVGIQPACAGLECSARFLLSLAAAGGEPLPKPHRAPAGVRALTATEQESVLSCLHEERFQDRSPAAVYATLLDEGHYHCSIRTMYRLLEERGASRERRDQLTHPPYQKPELLATAPNQLWSWGLYPNCSVRPSGPTFTSTSSWMSSAAMSPAGWWRRARARSSPDDSSRTPARRRTSNPVN